MIHSSEKGFSMIEVLISILLISIIIVSCMLFYGTSLRTSFTNKTQNIAVRLAQQTIEDLKQYDQLGFKRNSSLWTDPINPLASFSRTIDGMDYAVTKDIIDTAELSTNIRNNNNYIPIRVTVAWNYQGHYQIVVDTCLINWQ